MEETFARYETLNKLRKPDTTQINNVLDRLEKNVDWLLNSLVVKNDLKEEAESKVRQSQDAELATLLVRLIKTPVPYLESSDVRTIKTQQPPKPKSKAKAKPSPQPPSTTPTMAEVIQTNPEIPVSEFKGTATSSIVAPQQTHTVAEKSQPIHTTSLDPLTQVREASNEPPSLVSSREPSLEPEGQQLIRNPAEQELQSSSSWGLSSVLTTGLSMLNSKFLRDTSTATYLTQDQSQAPAVSTSDEAQTQAILAQSPEYAPAYISSTKTVVQPKETEVHEETLVTPPAGVSLPETTQTVNVVATPSPSSSIMETHLPQVQEQAQAPAQQPEEGLPNYPEEMGTVGSWEKGFYPYSSTNAPRKDIEHQFGNFKIEKTRSPLVSKDKAVGILPFPEAFKPWKYIKPRPYVLSSSLNKYQYYPTVHQAQNLKTKVEVK